MKQLTLRLPDDLHAHLKAMADGDRRSLHGEILYLIERGMGHDGRFAPEVAPPSGGRP